MRIIYIEGERDAFLKEIKELREHFRIVSLNTSDHYINSSMGEK